MSISDDLDAPITRTIAGRKIRLGILSLKDIADVDRELAELDRDEDRSRLGKMASSEEIRAVERRVIHRSFEGLAQECFSIRGCPIFLSRELVKGGDFPDRQAADSFVLKMARSYGWRDLGELAANASGLFPVIEDAPAAAEDSGPNVSAGTDLPAT